MAKVAKIGEMFFPLELYYSHNKRGHTWIKKMDDGNLQIGLDYYGAIPMMITTISHPLPYVIELPPAGTQLKQDQPYGLLETVKYIGPFYAPLTGTIVKINPDRVSSPPHNIRNSYVDGWFLILKPANYEKEIKNLLTGEEAVKWIIKDIIEYSEAEDEELTKQAKQGYTIEEMK
ncbi:MAG: hypothetical protein WED07_14575 [Candidatus Freyarchaeum deiterrae]